jgi:hypothetical protein
LASSSLSRKFLSCFLPHFIESNYVHTVYATRITAHIKFSVCYSVVTSRYLVVDGIQSLVNHFYTQLVATINYTAIANLTTLQTTRTCEVFSVFASRILATDL